MCATVKTDSSFLLNYKKDLDEAFKIYIDDIHPFIVQFEILKNEFPIEVQNEIRAMYAHLARASIATSPERIEENILKIRSHTKRALLDCYKYSCIAFADNYSAFFERYKGVDLSYLENGTFLSDVHSLYSEAKDKLLKAKEAETVNTDDEVQFGLYQNAYNKFVALETKLRNAEESANFLKHKAARKEVLAKISFVVGVVGLVVGLLGIIL